VVQFHDGADEILNHQGAKNHEGFWLEIFPSCTFVPLVVNDFANCTTTQSSDTALTEHILTPLTRSYFDSNPSASRNSTSKV